jgi:multiple sugar transport system ATP-binding protein
VELVERLGERTLIYGRLSNGQTITAEDQGNCAIKMGDEIGVLIDGSAGHVFRADGSSHHARAAA